VTSPQWIVPLSDVVGDDELVEAAADAVRSGWWSSGPRVAELEDRFAAYTGTQHALAVANGTAALHLALVALGIGPGDEVITPSLTFVAAANAVRLTGATPVFCDIGGPDDLNLDTADVESAITERTKAVLVLHYGGFPCDMDTVLELAARHGIAVVEDAAHGLGARIGDRSCGTLGAVGCFSFFANKNLPIGEGGMVVTDDPELADRLKLLRSHGMTTLTWDRHRGHASSYDVLTVGFNYRLDEIRAAMALVQLERLPALTRRRGALAERYVERLHGVAGIVVPFAGADRAAAAHHLAVVVLPEHTDREQVRAALAQAGVQTSVHYPPVHRFTAYQGQSTRELPRTESVADRLLTLPLYPTLSDAHLEHVVESVLAAVARPAQVREATG
jgi:dTDP-4-amino-4,6-dideoxygalactose transaminase